MISIHRTAEIIWAIKIIRIADAISPKQDYLRCGHLQQGEIISDYLVVCELSIGFRQWVVHFTRRYLETLTPKNADIIWNIGLIYPENKGVSPCAVNIKISKAPLFVIQYV